MQTFQLAIMVQFETVDELKFKELQEATLLTEDQLTRHIQSLLDCKLLSCDDEVIVNNVVYDFRHNFFDRETEKLCPQESSTLTIMSAFFYPVEFE
jgi:hypothetical protein